MDGPTFGGQSAAPGGESGAKDSSEILETEWQYDAPDLGALKKWLTENTRSGPLSGFPGKSRRIHDLYLDTPDLKILRAGYALRIRRTAMSAEATLKELAPRIEGLTVRREITKSLPFAHTAALFEGQDPVAERLRLLCREKELKTLGRIRTLRLVYRIIYHAEDQAPSDDEPLQSAEVALDHSLLTDSLGQVNRLSRLEIEVANEDLKTFRAVVDRLRGECGLRAAAQSKFEWALRVNGIRVDRTMLFGTVEIKRSMSVGRVADAVLRKHLASFLWHEPGTRLGDDPEHLHHMRVAGRRMRAALKLFCKAYPDGEADRLRGRLGEVGRHLGEVRDLDVFIDEIGRLRSRLLSVDDAACAPLLLHLARERDRARGRMRESLDSPAFDALKLDLARLVSAGPPAGHPEADASIVQFGPRVIRRAHTKARRLGRTLTLHSPAEQYHALRIRGKRLRYALEFLEDVYGAPAKDLVAVLIELQDLLGLHHDAWVSVNKLRTIASEKPAGFTPEGWAALGELSQAYHSRAESLRRGLRRLLQRVERRRWRALKRSMKKLAAEERRPDKESAGQQPSEDLHREHH